MFGSFPATNVANDSPVKAENAVVADEQKAENVQESVPEENVESGTEDSGTTSDESSEVSDDTKTEEEVRKPKKGFERRIEKFNQKLSAKEQEIEYWKKVALEGGVKTTPTDQTDPQGKPQFSQFNDIEAYTEALTDWKLSHSLAQVQQRSQIENTAKTYNERLTEFKKTTADFEEVMAEFVEDYGDVTVPEIVQVAMESEVGPQLAYHLAKNPDEVERIAGLPPHRRLVEGRMSKPVEKQVETKKISKAAAPVQPVKGSGKVESVDLRDPNVSYTEWVKRREASLKKR